MKKFILFSFLGLFVLSARAQDNFGDEFADPTLQNSTTEVVPENSNSTFDGILNSTEPISTPPVVESQPPLEFTNEAQNSVEPQSGDVILEKQSDFTQSYKERRGRHGVLFSIDYEKFYPADYVSQYGDLKIEDMIGTNAIDLFGGELGYKFNFSLGSLAVLANYAAGSTKGNGTPNPTTGAANPNRSIKLDRFGISANFAIDNIFQEPLVVPYVQAGIHQFQVIEDDLNQADSISTTTGISINYKLGLLFQLNWIENAVDPNSHLEGLRSSGLQNTFIDVYAMSHLASSDEADPDLSSTMEIGVGLKMEF